MAKHDEGGDADLGRFPSRGDGSDDETTAIDHGLASQ